jgi:peptide/nickel transport system substrate-binding protein
VCAAGFYNDSELSSIGIPASDKEKALLAPFPDAVDPVVMAGEYRPAGAGDRTVLREVVDELAAAGYALVDGKMIHTETDQPLAFEILVATPEDERIALAYQRVLDRVGVTATIRTVDSTQFQLRRKTFDFDMVRNTWGASLSPGNEQINRWSPSVADVEGSFNYPGAREPAIDALIDAMLSAGSREDFVAALRAYDRVLISGYYMVPLFYLPEQWVARWTRIERPETTALTGYSMPTWWAKPEN